MTTELILPKFNMDMEEATLLRWLHGEGDEIAEGDPVAEVETDKVNMEVEAPVGGVLTGLRYQEGDRIPVTAVIAIIAADRGEADRARAGGSSPSETRQPAARVAAGSGTPPPAVERETRGHAPGPPTPPGRVRATPAVRRLAREHSIDLAALAGREGRVSAEAIKRAIADQASVNGRDGGSRQAPGAVGDVPARPGSSAEAWGVAVGPDTSGQLDPTRRAIAARMTRAHEAPHITLEMDVRAGALTALRREAFREPPAMTALFAIAVAWALQDHPSLNATFDAGELTVHRSVDLGIAVARPSGLIVPVLHGAHALSVPEASRRVTALVERAREGQVRIEEVTGGTFTITSLGELGIDRFSPLVNPPQVAILGIGRIAPRVVPIAGGIGVEALVTLSLTCDHRVVDGAPGAMFLATLRGLIEEPAWMASVG